MGALERIVASWGHASWADRLLLEALRATGRQAPPQALAEYAHVLGAEETWLARIEGRTPEAAVWPDASLESVAALAERTERSFARYMRQLTEEGLRTPITYRNSAGREFTSTVGDILLHVALHGQYHRGKVNLLLRQAGLEPAPVDYIAYVRGTAAATRAGAADGGRRTGGG